MRKKADNKIPLTERIKTYFSQNWRICIYTLCGLGLCWIDLWRGIGNGAQWALAVNCTGFCILPLIIFRLDWKILLPNKDENVKWHKLLRVCFYGWVALFAILAYPAFKHFAPGTDYDAQIATAVANVGLYGAIVVRMYFYLFYEKKENEKSGKKDYKVTWVFWLWLAFIALAIVSVNESIWPLWFMVMFGSFYLAPLRKGDMEEIVEGLVNGMIIGFFWIQSRAFLYRPYDLEPRYRGHYTNPNVNAMFYLFIYVAWLVKLTICRIRKEKYKYTISFFMASSMWVFVLFTGCRSALIGFMGISVFYWTFESVFLGIKPLLTFIKKGVLMLVCFAVSFMPVFMCMRYIPSLRHHPIWYGGEYSENSVMSWDDINSPKYMELDEIFSEIFGRFFSYPQSQTETSDDSFMDISIFMVADASESIKNIVVGTASQIGNQLSYDGQEVYWYEDGVAPGTDWNHPVFRVNYSDGNIFKRFIGIRYYIYRYIIENVHLLGNEGNLAGVWITDNFPLYHAHNTVLQMTYWFGPLSGILFILIILLSLVELIKGLRKDIKETTQNEHICTEYFFALVIIGYFLMGLAECIAFPGEMGLTLFFLSLISSLRNCCENNKKTF